MSRAVPTRVLAGLLGAALLLGPAPAAAQDATTTAPAAPPAAATPDGTSTVAWPDLGLPAGLELSGPNLPQTYEQPVPQGLLPVQVSGTLIAPVSYGAGYLEVQDVDGTFLGAVNLPPQAGERIAVPFSLPVGAGPVVQDRQPLTFVLRQAAGLDVECSPPQQVAVTDLRTTFLGSASSPTTIDEFFPGLLRELVVATDPDATPAEQQALLALVAAAVRHYGQPDLTVRFAPVGRAAALPPAGDPATSRTVVLREGTGPGLEVAADGAGRTLLVVRGDGPALLDQVALLSRTIDRIAQVAEATVVAAPDRVLTVAPVYTLSELGQALRLEVLGERTGAVTIDESLVGGPLSSARVHLRAGHTPVVDDDDATLTVSVEDVVLAAKELDEDGEVDLSFTIPAELLRRRTQVQLRVTYAPEGECAPFTPQLELTVDPRSTVTVTRATVADGGFEGLPAAFLDGFDVALAEGDPELLGFAVRAVAGVQSLSSAVLTPRVRPLAEVLDGRASALVVAPTDALGDLSPPIDGRDDDVAVRDPFDVRAQLPEGVGTVQAFTDVPRDRTVLLVTTTSTWDLVGPLFDHVEEELGWNGLTGDVLVAGAAVHPANLTIRAGGPRTFAPEPTEAWRRWVLLGAGAGAVVLALVVLALVRARRDPG